MTNTRFYRIFCGIKERCDNENRDNYNRYGGRGIKCEWKNFEEFKNDMYESYLIHFGKYGKDTSIDRINNNGNYCKKNCQFSTIKIQANNTRRNHFITYKNKTQTMAQWADELNINRGTLLSRINNYNWSVERSLNK